MIEATVIITAMLIILMMTAMVMYRARLEAQLDFIDELVKRGFDISKLIEEDGYSD